MEKIEPTKNSDKISWKKFFIEETIAATKEFFVDPWVTIISTTKLVIKIWKQERAKSSNSKHSSPQ